MNTTTTTSSQLTQGAAPAASQPSQEAMPAEDQAGSVAAGEDDDDDDEDGGAGDAPDEGGAEAAPEPVATELPEKKVRARRGPPADGKEEPRKVFILTTSKLTGPDGERLRRGMAVSVPVRRADVLLKAGRVRQAPKGEIEAAERRFGLGRIG